MKAGLVAVAGRPNVGKSTLVNALTGEKVAITSTVPNTTRRRIFGVANGDDWQLVLVDLPGFQRPMDALTERMQETVDVIATFSPVNALTSVDLPTFGRPATATRPAFMRGERSRRRASALCARLRPRTRPLRTCRFATRLCETRRARRSRAADLLPTARAYRRNRDGSVP